jgi:tetratricopeptide (TPR) repeat protein
MSAFDTEYDLGNGVIRLMKPSAGCERAVLAYWAQGMAVGVVDIDKISPQDPHIRGEAMLNGQKIKVEFDTGAPASILKRSAAERAGFRVDGPGVQAAGVSGGIGSRLTESWVAPFELLDIGGEQIKNTRLRVSGISLERADMLLGADFFLSHRIYVPKQQHRIYCTSNGGPVFRLDRAGVAAAAPSAPPAAGGGPGPSPGAPAAPGPYADAPTDAAGFVRRGEASMSRRDFAGAIADFSRAAELEPNAPQHFRERARAHLLKGEPLLAMADFDQALKLKPDDAASLIGRGELFLVSRDAVRAKADFDAALRLEPDRGLQVAGIYTAVGRFEEAIGQYDAWIAAHPAAPALTDAFNGRCWARTLWNHELDKALADCEAALKRGPKTAALLDSRGLAHLRRKELDAAIADYDQALRLQPRLAWAMLGRGLAKRAKGDEAGAEADIAAAAALAPGLPAVARRYGLMEPAAKPAAS